MFDLNTLKLGAYIGGRVRALRLARGWSQRDLAAALAHVSPSWTRAKVGQLEATGVRGEKLTDLAMLCLALEISLEDLLAGDEPGTAQMPRAFLQAAISGPATVRAISEAAIDPSRIGAEDSDAESRLAARLGLNRESTREAAMRLFEGATPSQARDALAGIDESTSPREAQAKRGQAMRKVVFAMETDSVGDEALETIRRWLSERNIDGND